MAGQQAGQGTANQPFAYYVDSLFRSDPFQVTHFTLFSSLPGSENSVYHAERSYALTARPEPSMQNAGR